MTKGTGTYCKYDKGAIKSKRTDEVGGHPAHKNKQGI
jgi:hypothetical protein